jgi:4-diphosphocytidyl-2-C-methyl-D-erythritol kinase
MVAVDLADQLELDESGSGLTIDAGPESRAWALAAEDNLVERALAACGRSARVHLTKRIPVRGGLGGGSADAAAILRWSGCTDLDVAVRLGADVPFCLVGGRALVEGAGERVTPLSFEDRDFLLLVPPFGVDTPSVYRAWDRVPSDRGPNALADAAVAVEPRLLRWRDAFGDLTGTEPTLAGSGSTWFVEGVLPERVAAVEELRIGTERARLIRASAVPAGWDGG